MFFRFHFPHDIVPVRPNMRPAVTDSVTISPLVMWRNSFLRRNGKST